MPTTVQFRRGSTAENDNFTGAVGELSVDTTLNQVRVHDGVTAGGHVVGDGDHATWTELLATNTAIRTLVSNNLANTNAEIDLLNTNLTATNTAIRSLVSSNDTDITNLQNEDSALWSAITTTNTAIRSITTANATEIGDVWSGLIATNTAIRSLVTSNDSDISSLQTEDSNLWSALTATNTAIRSLVSSNDNDISAINTNLDQKLGATASIAITGDVAGSGSFSSNSVSISVSQQNNSVDLGTHTTGNYVATVSGTTGEIEVSGSGSETAAVTVGLPNDVTISNDLTVGNDLTIQGNFTVTGTTTTIDVTNLKVGDPLIGLNANLSSGNSDDMGLIFNRGTTGSNAMFIWDESADTFVLGTGSHGAGASGNLTVTDGALKLGSLDVSGNVDVDGSLETDALSINGTTVSATAAELNTLDGITSTTAELNTLDGYTGSVTELNYLKSLYDTGVTSSEFNILDGVTATAAEINKLDGVTATTAEINYVDGVTSNIQTQLNAKQATITGAATTIDDTNLTASRAVVSDGSGKIAVSAVTSTELGYLDGVTSAIQTQLNAKAATSSLGTLATLNTVNASTITDNSVGAAELNVTGNGTSGQYLASDGDGSMTWTTLSSDPSMGGDISGVASNAQIVANAVGAAELNVSGNGTTSQFLRADGDGSFTWATPTDTNTTYTGGSGITLSGTTFNLDTDVRGDMYTMGRDTNDYYTVGTTTHNWYLDGAEDMRLTNTGVLDVENNVIAHSSTVSDRNLKDDIEKIEGALDMVKALNGYTFTYKKDGRLGAGLIAQEVQEVLPRAVTEHEILNIDGSHLVLEYDQIHGILVEAIKEQQAQIEELKNIINSK